MDKIYCIKNKDNGLYMNINNKKKDAFNTIDGLKDWGNDPIGKDKDGILRDELAHTFSVLDNIKERQKSLTKEQVKMLLLANSFSLNTFFVVNFFLKTP